MEGMLRSDYSAMLGDRTVFTTAAVNAAELTIPNVFVEDNNYAIAEYPEPVDGFGARAVNNLASKVMMTLMPVNQSGFRIAVDQDIEEAVKAEQGPEVWNKIETEFLKKEEGVLRYLERINIRAKMFELIRLLIVTGNALIWMRPDDKVSIHNLNDYVLRRDSSGKFIYSVLKQCVNIKELPSDIPVTNTDADDIDIYTGCEYNKTTKKYKVWQEIEDVTVAGSVVEYDELDCPFIPVRWNVVSNCPYGLGLVGESIGDFRSLEGFTKAILEFSAYMAWNPMLANPAGQTDPDEVANAESMDIIDGMVQDVQPIAKPHMGNIQPAYQARQDIIQNLSAVFMLNSSIQRNAERVTAEEIRMMASELENALGGVYSLLVTELQSPLLNWVFRQVDSEVGQFEVKQLDGARLQIVTGFEALSKNSEFQRLMLYNNSILAGPVGQFIIPRMKHGVFAEKAATTIGLVPDFLMSEEEYMQQQQMQQQQQMNMSALQGGLESTPDNQGN